MSCLTLYGLVFASFVWCEIKWSSGSLSSTHGLSRCISGSCEAIVSLDGCQNKLRRNFTFLFSPRFLRFREWSPTSGLYLCQVYFLLVDHLLQLLFLSFLFLQSFFQKFFLVLQPHQLNLLIILWLRVFFDKLLRESVLSWRHRMDLVSRRSWVLSMLIMLVVHAELDFGHHLQIFRILACLRFILLSWLQRNLFTEHVCSLIIVWFIWAITLGKVVLAAVVGFLRAFRMVATADPFVGHLLVDVVSLRL